MITCGVRASVKVLSNENFMSAHEEVDQLVELRCIISSVCGALKVCRYNRHIRCNARFSSNDNIPVCLIVNFTESCSRTDKFSGS